MRGMVLLLLLLLLLLVLIAFLDMKKRLDKRRAKRVVPSHAVGMDGGVFWNVSMTRPGSREGLVSFVVAMLGTVGGEEDGNGDLSAVLRMGFEEE